MSDVKIERACAWCGAPMVLRRNRTTDQEFLGCSNYPECSRTEKAPAYLEMIRQGAAQLPGF